MKRKSTTNVTSATIASTSGRWSIEALLQVHVVGREARDQQRRRGSARARPRGPGCCEVSGASAETTSTTLSVAPRAASASATSAAPCSSAASAATRWASSGSAGHRDLHRAVAERAGSRRAARRRPGGRWPSSGSTWASTEVNSIWKNGMPSAIRNGGAGDRDPAGDAHHERDSRYQKPLVHRGRLRPLCRRWRNFGASEFTRSPSSARIAGSTISAIAAAISGDERAADPHRVQEALREDAAGRRGRRRPSARRTGRCARPSPSCAAHRLEARAAAGDLLAVARDDEQAVVDRQAEPEARSRG